jgi:hypothetical protein
VNETTWLQAVFHRAGNGELWRNMAICRQFGATADPLQAWPLPGKPLFRDTAMTAFVTPTPASPPPPPRTDDSVAGEEDPGAAIDAPAPPPHLNAADKAAERWGGPQRGK